MSYIIDKSTGTSAYLQLYTLLKADIISSVYPYGSKLPSMRVIAADTGLSIITVRHSYSLLCEEGYIEARERSGFIVAFRSDDGFVSSGAVISPKHVTHAEHGNSHEFPFTVLAKTMRRVLLDYSESIQAKSPNQGCPELLEAISRYLKRSRGIHAESNRIIIGSGAEYLYSLVANLLGKNRIFALEYPSYEKIQLVYQSAGVKCELLPLCSDGIESEALGKSRADVLHVSPYRSFPTGVSASASKRHEYIRWAERGDRFLIEDDFESEFSISSKPEETLFSLSGSDNVIYLNTFSMTVSPAMRVGYMVLPKRLAELFLEKLGFYSCTVPTYEQFVLAELISSGDFERHINRIRRAKRKELQKNLK